MLSRSARHESFDYTELHFRWGFRRQPEQDEGQAGQKHTGQNEDVVVEGHLPPDDQFEDKVHVWLWTTWVFQDVSFRRRLFDVPFVA